MRATLTSSVGVLKTGSGLKLRMRKKRGTVTGLFRQRRLWVPSATRTKNEGRIPRHTHKAHELSGGKDNAVIAGGVLALTVTRKT